MTNRKTVLKASLAAVLALGTIAGASAPASANGFSFSWSTPNGTISVGPNGHVRQRHVRPQRQELTRAQARQALRQAGYRNISFVRERSRTLVFQVSGRHGQRQVSVNKLNGRIS